MVLQLQFGHLAPNNDHVQWGIVLCEGGEKEVANSFGQLKKQEIKNAKDNIYKQILYTFDVLQHPFTVNTI